MKVVILAGGFGTRISEYTHTIPKPMVRIGNKPIIWHIMKHYAKYHYNNFYLALGYKSEVIKEYFENQLEEDEKSSTHSNVHNWNIQTIDTGLNTMTGGRVKRLKEYLKNETFLLTYGDALSNINIQQLVNFHKNHGKLVTVSAVHPSARFGELNLKEDKVLSFNEKPQTKKDWINGGFFVVSPKFIDYIDDDKTVLEKYPLETVAKEGELMAYRHDDFWQCMDTKRDHDLLEEQWKSGSPPWTNI